MNKPNLIMTVGVQGAGKSTWAKKYSIDNPDVRYLSTDVLRAEMGFGVDDQSVNGLVYMRLKQKTESSLKKGQSVLLDATFIKKAWRNDYTKLGRKNGAYLIAHVFTASRDTLVKRVAQRAANGGLNVPVEVIDKYIAQFQAPIGDEFDEVINHKE